MSTELSGTMQWTCPTRPKVSSAEPGVCTLRSETLERRARTDSAPADAEVHDLQRRFWLSLLLSVPITLLSMNEMLPGHPLDAVLSTRGRAWTELALATPVCLWAAWPFYERAYASVRNRTQSMFTLIGIGVCVAYGYSLAATLAPELFPRDTSHRAVPVYFAAGAMVVTMVLLGQVLERRARRQVRSAIQQLIGLTPKLARRIGPDDHDELVALESLVVGDRLRVRPGERVPVDGLVLEGTSYVHESTVTGEAVAVRKQANDRLVGATINGVGALTMRADKIGGDTLLARVDAMVAETQRSSAPIQRFAEKLARSSVPIVLVVSMTTFLMWLWLGPEPRLTYALMNAVFVLIIACPCALGLATPISIMVASGRGPSIGVLFKDAEAIELLQKVDTLVVDKTGTLTEGRLKLLSVIPVADCAELTLLRLAGSLERGSEHPLAAAIATGARERGVLLTEAHGLNVVAGKGVQGVVDGRTVAVGNHAFLDQLGIPMTDMEKQADLHCAEGRTVVLVAVDDSSAGLFIVEDPLKHCASEAIPQLQADGIRVVMLTGDAELTARSVAKRLGIVDVIAGVLPDQKAMRVRELQAQGHVVAMAGDGINDAPALAQAEVGIAMGNGTDIAMESAGVTLVKGDLRGIVQARRLSRITMRNLKQNLFLAFIYNAISIPIAAGVLYPSFGFLLSPMLGAAAISLSSAAVIANALRLKAVRL